MKKILLLLTLVCLMGASKIYAQAAESANSQEIPAAAVLQDNAPKDVPVQTGTSVNEDSQKPAVKKSCGSSSSTKSCCMSKKSSASKKNRNDEQAEKVEEKNEKTETAPLN